MSKGLVGIVAVLFVASVASAGTLWVTYELDDILTTGYASVMGNADTAPDEDTTQDLYYVYDLELTWTNSADPCEIGFGNLALDCISDNTTGDPNITLPFGFTASNPQVTYPIASPPFTETGNAFEVLGDKGTDTADAQDIVASIAGGLPTNAADQRTLLGQGGLAGLKFGSLYILREAHAVGTVSGDIAEYSYNKDPNGDLTIDDDDDAHFGDEVGTEDSIEFTPEPTTIALLGLGGLALIRRRK